MNEIIEVKPISSDVADDSVKKADNALILARSVMITTDEQYSKAGNQLVSIKQFLKDLEVERKKITDPLTKAKDAVMAFFNPPKENATKAVNLISKAMIDYDEKKAEAGRIAQAKLQAEADKKARALEERAKAAEAKGNIEKAEALKQEAMLKKELVPVVNVEPIKIDNARVNEVFKGEVKPENKKIFIDWCVKTENWDLLLPNDKEVTAIAKRSKGTRVIPGVTFWSEKSIAGSR